MSLNVLDVTEKTRIQCRVASAQPMIKIGFLEVLNQIQSQYGLIVLVLVSFLVFVCFLLWKLIWKVWCAAMAAKDREIERVSKERDKYQALVFERLRSSEVSASTVRVAGKSGKK